MADQKRWFKVWTSLLVDMDNLSNEVIGAWTRLGCRAALVGEHGAMTFDDWAHLGRFLNVPPDAAQELSTRLRNVDIEEGKTRHGVLTVTFKNWTKYQEDSTQAERAKASRSKRRGEERRADERRQTPLEPSALGPPSPIPEEWPDAIRDVRTRLLAIQAPTALLDPGYWARIDEWLGPDDSGVTYLTELDKYLAWVESLPPQQRKRDHRRGFRNWLTKEERNAIERRRRHAQNQVFPRR